MSDINFGRLSDLPLREAWKSEAREFTPWLAEKIDHLSEAIGMELELTGTEVAVDTFSADILARNPMDDTTVLIENQLERTDHTHLGQIMTYLAGLEAQSVIWIAPMFREAHLSAVRWLNRHTSDGFSFFAVKVRVVRIGESPFAPIFEVLEKPNDWDRELQVQLEGAKSEISRRRAAYWDLLLERHPDLSTLGINESAKSNQLFKTGVNEVYIGLYLASRTCGIYLRGPARSNSDGIHARLEPYKTSLEERLGVPFAKDEEPNWFLTDKIQHPITDEANWPKVADWMAGRLKDYVAALEELPGAET